MSKKLNLEPYKAWDWSIPNRELSRIHGVNRETVRNIRIRLGIAAFRKPLQPKLEPPCPNLAPLTEEDMSSPNWKRNFLRHVCKEETVRSKHVQDPCWIWTGTRLCTKRGETYGRFSCGGKANHRQFLAHRVSFLMFHGPIPAKLLVRHKCEEKLCVNPAHIELGTYAQNTADSVARKVIPVGSKKHCSKLTEDSVRAFRERWRNGEKMINLSREAGVDDSTMHHALHGINWRHVQ